MGSNPSIFLFYFYFFYIFAFLCTKESGSGTCRLHLFALFLSDPVSSVVAFQGLLKHAPAAPTTFGLGLAWPGSFFFVSLKIAKQKRENVLVPISFSFFFLFVLSNCQHNWSMSA